MTIIIPLTGQGQRFIDAGYKDIKPLVKVNGKTIIEYVVDMFDKNDSFIFIVNEQHVSTTPIIETIKNILPTAQIEIIASHKLGPNYAVSQIFHTLKDEEQYIVNYCDFFMLWDYQAFKTFVNATHCDGAIPCYKGFHPHLVHEHNVYAGCRVNEENILLEIKEKFTFTENKTESHHSVGTYYFKSGALLKKYITIQIENNVALNGEFYTSLTYPKMIEDGLTIKVYDAISHFCQWGTPFDLNEFEYWQAIIKNFNQTQIAFEQPTAIVMPMAGNGQRFVDKGYTIAKPMLPVYDKQMYQTALSFLPLAEKHIFITKEKLEETKLPTNSTQIVIEKTTQGQACTALLAKNSYAAHEALMITPCDNGMLYNQAHFLALTKIADVILFGFKSYQAVTINPKQYGWVLKDDNNSVKKISCKTPVSDSPINDYAITGAFWFKQATLFEQAAEKMIAANDTINNEFYIDVAINYCIANGLNVKLMPIDYYICWGTPNDYETFLYWDKYHKLMQ